MPNTWTVIATTGFGGVVTPGVMTFGLDDDTVGANSPGKYGNVQVAGNPIAASISCVTLPGLADAIFDVLYSADNGTTWHTIFITGSPFRFPASATGHIIEFSGIFGTVSLTVGNLLRVDTVQSGGALGITGVVQWG